MKLARRLILDTNVVSEPTRVAPDPRVAAWFDAQVPGTLYLTATVVCEIAEGIECLPTGSRRRNFERWLRRLIEAGFADRILSLDHKAALIFGRLVAQARAMGRRPQTADAQIAAVAEREGMVIATRDISDFEPFGVPLINPWTGFTS